MWRVTQDHSAGKRLQSASLAHVLFHHDSLSCSVKNSVNRVDNYTTSGQIVVRDQQAIWGSRTPPFPLGLRALTRA